MTLTEFLTARLDEDEAVANRAYADSDWTTTGVWNGSGQHVVMAKRRLLAEVEAKRRIVEQCTHGGRMEPTENSDDLLDWLTLRFLAAIYSDHPDYDEAWRA